VSGVPDPTVSVKRRAPPLRAVALSIAGLGILAILVWWVNPARLASTLRHADARWVLLALMAIVISAVIGAYNSYLMAVPGRTMRFSAFFPAYWAAWALNQVVPGQVGDLLGLSLFLRRQGLTLPTAVGRLSVDKLISLFCTLALSAGLLVIFEEPMPRLAGMAGAAAAASLLLTYLFSRRIETIVHARQGWRAYLLSGLREAHQVVSTRSGAVTANMCLTVVKLFVIGFCYWAIFCALHVAPGGLFDVAVTANSTGLVAYVPISANGLGTVEAAGIYLFGLHGVGAPVVLATYLTLRVCNLTLAWGGTALLLLANALPHAKTNGVR